MLSHGRLASSSLNSTGKKSAERMAKSAYESIKDRRLRRSRNVPSFFEESTESITPPKTVNVVVDIHNESGKLDRRQQDDTNKLDDKTTIKRSSEDSKATSRASEGFRNRFVNRENLVRNRRDKESRDDQTIDLIEVFETPKKGNESPDEKPHQRKQWNTVSMANEMQDLKGRTQRKRWSKDTSVIRLPETSDDPESPLIDNPRDPPIPMPRCSVPRNALFFDNPAFASENDDEVLRIETDHNRDSTKIEIRRMSDASASIKNIEEAGTSSGNSWKKNRRKVTTTSERFLDSDDRSSKTRSSEIRENSIGKTDSSTSLEKVTDIRSNSITSEERLPSTSERISSGSQREGSLRKRGRPLFKKKESPGDKEVSSSARDASSMFEVDARIRKKKKRKRKQLDEQQNVSETKEEKKETKHISVTIHRADLLEADYVNVKRPMVKVHIVEARTGSYLMNTAENGGTAEDGGLLQPMITGKFDFKENRSMIPVWEEELIFEHDFNAIVRRESGDQVVILFEVIDLLSFAEASVSYDRIGSEGCWNKIAWAFLKPIGVNDTLHTDKKVRLQLYRPKQSFKRYGKHKCEVHSWWQSNNRDKYPSSLLVTITSVSPRKLEPVIYQQLPLDDLLDDTRSVSRGPSTRTSDSIGLPKWARLAAQSCKIPNETIFETEASENGCFYVAFSNDGKYLACVHSEEYNYPIIVYEVETGKIHVRFLGHKTFVYSLNWSSNDHHLISASADQTARIWDVRNQIIQHIEMLPHPSYVYCAKYGPEKETIVATGCYDQVARIWTSDRKSKKRELNQELEGHEGFVNSVAFQKSSNLITADSVGSIILWTVRKNSRMPLNREWCISRKIKIREIEGVVINTIVLHPLESRLLVHSRDNGLRLVDLATGVILQRYKQLNNQRIQLKACISPCGGLVLCGGEDSVLNVWSLESGKHQARYTSDEQSSRMIVSCVDYHPYDHILAFSTFGGPTSVRILRFNKNASGNNIRLKLTEGTPQIHGNEMILNVFDRPLSQQNTFSNGNTVTKKQVSSSHHSTIDRTIIQIEDTDDREQLWIKLRRLKEMERNWKKKSMDRLYCIIQKIDSMLSKTSMSSEDFAEARSVHKEAEGDALHVLEEGGGLKGRIEKFCETEFFSVNEHKSSFVESSVSSNVVLTRDVEKDKRKTKKQHRYIAKERPKSAKEPYISRLVDQHGFNKTLSDSAANSARFHVDFQDSKDRRFDFAVHVRNQDHSHNFLNFEKPNTSEASRVPSVNSSDSTGTYTLKIHSNKNNISDIKTERINSIHGSGDDSSQISDATFVIEH